MKKGSIIVGPYSRFIKAPLNKSPIFFSGVIGNCPKSGKIVAKTRTEEINTMMENLKMNMEMAEVHKNDIIKVTAFLGSMEDYGFFNNKYLEFMEDHRPTRSCVAVKELPLGANFEIEIVAYK